MWAFNENLASVGTRRPSARICRVTHAGGHRIGFRKHARRLESEFTSTRRKTEFNPVTLEILWNRLISIADQSATTLVRTSFSTVVRESNDYACVLMDRNGDTLAENSGSIPSFVGTMSRTVKHFLRRFPPETWKPGDVVITNDPWMGTGHRPDFSMATPVFLTVSWWRLPGSSPTPRTSEARSSQRTTDRYSKRVSACHP